MYAPTPTPGRHASRSGQAMVEMVAALLCILAVMAGLLQLVLMGTADTDTMVEATAQAAARATSGVLLSETPDPIADWEPGNDGMEQTKDDEPVPGSLAGVRQNIAGPTAPDGDWAAVDAARHNAIAELHHGLLPASTFGLVRGSASRDVEVIPVAKALFGLRDPTDVENEVWTAAVGGLY